jgi:hypothetical protein
MRAARLLSLCLIAAACSSTPPSSGDSGTPLSCKTNEHVCGGACSDPNLDSANCGDCGLACKDGESCAGGRCYTRDCPMLTCAGTQVCATDVCVDRSCFGLACDAGTTCAGGSCVPTTCGSVDCPSGQVCMSNACVPSECVGVICPSGLICSAGVCSRDTCSDGVKDGTETDVDCGGICPACVTGGGCTAATNCVSLVCSSGKCAAPACDDHVRNGNEGDVDCGGSCPPCADGLRCTSGMQCADGSCSMGTCAAPSCTDGVKNGNETDVDCGGSCGKCSNGSGCTAGADCTSGLCNMNKCFSSGCQDGMKDGTETDTDCGGSCYPCANGRACLAATDCLNGICDSSKHCGAPTCTDLVKNGTETDTDCGGSCSGCAVGKGCAQGKDCLTGVCTMQVCQVAQCNDSVKNGTETDIDCGGDPICPRCIAGKACVTGPDCLSGICNASVCQPQPLLAVAVPFDLGRDAGQIVVADLDNDSLADVAVANEATFNISVFFGARDGGLDFGPPLQVSQPNYTRGPSSISAGDVNGDGRLDLVTGRSLINAANGCGYISNFNGCTISVMLGAGNRNFLGGVDSTVGNILSGCGYRVAVGRINADARADIVTGDELRDAPATCCCGNRGQSDLVGGYLWIPDMTGMFPATAPTLAGLGPYVQIADLNSDGNNDVIGRSVSNSRVRVLLSNGTGTFSPPIDIGVAPGPGELTVARIDADNTLDFVVASKTSNQIGVSLGVGDGNFLAPRTYMVNSPDGVAVADLDGDGKFDIVVGGIGVVVLRGNGDGSFQTPEVFAPQLGDVVEVGVGDFDGDGKPDVVAIANDRLWLLRNARP